MASCAALLLVLLALAPLALAGPEDAPGIEISGSKVPDMSKEILNRYVAIFADNVPADDVFSRADTLARDHPGVEVIHK